MKRLTPKQRVQFLAVAETWGDVFRCYTTYSYLANAGLVERATADQIDRHYEALAAKLASLVADVRLALDAGDYKRAALTADDAKYTYDEITERAETAPNLVTLSARGHELAAKLIAERDARLAAYAAVWLAD
jgi:hypothetical protein